MIDRAAQRLLRRHVGERAEHDVPIAHPHRALCGLHRRRGAGVHALGQTEVEDLHRALRRDHDVGALEIAVHHMALPRFFEGARHLEGDAEDRVGGHRPRAQHRRQRAAFDGLHRDVRPAVGFADFEDRADVGMVQCRRRGRFALEEGASIGIVGDIGPEDLHGDGAAEHRILGEVDLAHAASTEKADNSESTEAWKSDGRRRVVRLVHR